MKISTISFELQNETMAQSSEKRIEYIVEAVLKTSPDLLLTSGYSLESNDDLLVLVDRLSDLGLKSTIVVEVKNDSFIEQNGHPVQQTQREELINNASKHCMYLITEDLEIIRLGAQIFAQSAEVSKKSSKPIIEVFKNEFPKRIFTIKNKKVAAICCGEINVILGRDNIRFIDPELESALKSCDVILNPTHDCMANYGTLKAKRKYFSNMNNKSTIYVNSSNWNSKKQRKNGFYSQHRTNSYMQNTFQNGEKVIMDVVNDSKDYVLKSVELS